MGGLWLRFVIPLARLTLSGLGRIIGLLAREGARIAIVPTGVTDAACGVAFSGFAE